MDVLLRARGIMDMAAWSAGVILAVAAAFGLGYWFGYKCGRHDAESGVGEP